MNAPAPSPDPFEAIPVFGPGVEYVMDENERVRIERVLPEKPGLGEFLARKWGFRRSIRVNLDEKGTFYWRQIDGKKSLHVVQKSLAARYRLNRRESRLATVQFTNLLMRRGLIYLKMAPLAPTRVKTNV